MPPMEAICKVSLMETTLVELLSWMMTTRLRMLTSKRLPRSTSSLHLVTLRCLETFLPTPTGTHRGDMRLFCRIPLGQSTNNQFAAHLELLYITRKALVLLMNLIQPPAWLRITRLILHTVPTPLLIHYMERVIVTSSVLACITPTTSMHI
jgi:hypothetical protein